MAETSRGRVGAERILLATEGYTQSITGLGRKLIPFHSMMVATQPLTDAQLEWSDQPTFVLFEQFERWTSIEIEGADVTTLLDLTHFVLEDDSKR